MRPERRGEAGFTLIEMSVAIIVLAVGIAGALATFGSWPGHPASPRSTTAPPAWPTSGCLT